MVQRIKQARLLFFLLFLLLCTSCSTETQPVDMVIIVDTSMSMRGVGGTADIFSSVLETAQEIASEAVPGSNISVISYASDTHLNKNISVSDVDDVRKANQEIAGLIANGKYTYTAKAIRDGLDRAAGLENSKTGNRQVVVLLTDGLNDPPPGAGDSPLEFNEVMQSYAGKPWYVFYVQLGNNIDEDLQSALKENFSNTKVINDPEGLHLEELKRTVAKDWKKPVLKITKWVGFAIAGLLALLVLVILVMRTRSYAQGKQLYGTLEYWEPGPTGMKGKVDLAECGTRIDVGSKGIELRGVDTVVAQLHTSQEDGQWVVVIQSKAGDSGIGGMISYKSSHLPSLTLYDGDLFEIGSWSFRYRGDTGRRPK